MNNGVAIPYFKSEWGVAYTQQQQQEQPRENISARGSKSAGAMSNSYILFLLLYIEFFIIRIIKW
jgi:hypothetical protein